MNKRITAQNGHFSAEDIASEQRCAVGGRDSTRLEGEAELVRALAANEEPADAPVAPAGAPIVFLDLDDVVCLCDPVGGLQALECVNGERSDGPDYVYKRLFDPRPVRVLRMMHEAMGGHLRYVISSTWREVFTRAQMRHVLRQSGLGFVADCLEDQLRWATPRSLHPDRYREVTTWIGRHYGGEPYIVIDDDWSGSSLGSSLAYPLRVVLCTPEVGLEDKHLENLLRGLRSPPGQYERW